jgi:type IV pilus assembly protein PilN
MIRINLLPVREARRQAGLQKQAALLGGAVALGAVICVWMHVSVSSAQSDELRRIIEAKAELKQLEVTRNEVERFRKEKEEIERKLGVIATLEQSRQGPVRIMDEIAMRIPKRMWLTQLKMQGGSLEMSGVSLDAEIVAAFLASLGESELFQDVELDETRLSETDGLKLNSFKIHSRYVNAAVAQGNAPSAKGLGRGAR